MTNRWDKIKYLVRRFKDLTTIGFANVTSSAISGVFWFYLASLLGTTHYGEISYFIAISSIASIVSFLGTGNTIIVYTAKGEKIQSTLFFITIVSSFIASIVLFFVFYNLGVSLYILGYAIFGLATSEILGRKLYKDYSKYLITQKILFVGFTLAFYYLMGPQGVILGYAVSFFPYFFRIYRGFRESKIDFSVIKPRFGFMMNNYVLDLSRAFSGQTDKLIIGPMLGFALLGNYQLGIQFLSLLSLLPSIVYQYILPQDASGNPNKKLKKVTILVSVFLAILGISLSPIVLPALFPNFNEAIEAIQIISLAIIPVSINLVYISKFLGEEKSKIILFGSGIYLLAQILGIIILGQLYGINGAATALVLATASEAIYLIIVDRFYSKNKSMKSFDLSKIEVTLQPITKPLIINKPLLENLEENNSKMISIIDFVEKKLDFFAKNTIISLLIIGGLALFLRLYYFPFDVPITLDSLDYFWYAIDTSILGHLPTTYAVANNGWPIFLSIFFSIFQFDNFMDYMILQRLVTVAISILTIIPVYLLCNRFFDKPYAIIGAAIFAFEPRIIQNSLLGITEPLYIILITSALVLFLSSNRKMTYVSFGIIALAAIVRVEGVILFFPLLIMFFVRYRKERRVIARCVLASSIFVLLLLPIVIFRIKNYGSDFLTSRITGDASEFLTTSLGGNGFTYLISAIENFVKLSGWSLIPIFIFFVPIGFFLIFKKRSQENVVIILVIISMMLPVFDAFSAARDTRYIYPLFPLFCILSTLTVKTLGAKLGNRNIFLILLIGGLLLASGLFLDFKKVDIEHEKEALALSYYIAKTTSGINPYLPESKYLSIPQMTDREFPVLSTSIPVKPKLIPTDGFSSLEEYIKVGKENGLTHLVLDGEDKFYRAHFFKDAFFNKEKYPYLTKEFDSLDNGYKYHLKIYKIDYDKFYSIIKHD